MNRMIITKYKDQIITALEENDIFTELHFSKEEDSILGNIYVGRVEKKLKNIKAYFVSYAKDKTAFLPEDDCKNVIVLSPTTNKDITVLQEGTLILVQITKEAIKTKDPTVTTNISLQGKYCIVDLNKNRYRYSSKLSKKERFYLKNKFDLVKNEAYGYLVRTKVESLDKESYEKINQELTFLYDKMDNVLRTSKARTKHSLLYQASSSYVRRIRDLNLRYLDRITTDEPIIFEEVQSFLKEEDPAYLERLVFYKDSSFSLHKLYRIEKHVEHALHKNVYLKNGASLYIEQTEALNVIDVNSGKAIKGKIKEDTFLKINLIAAKEIARQIRLRNLSGIIIIDFINMEDEQNIDKLIILLHELFQKDPVKTKFIDITKLGLVEVTRKRIFPSIKEQIGLNR